MLTGFGIFQHGGFGKPHALGRASIYVETLSYTTTFFFHFVPGVTEPFVRLPVGAPLQIRRLRAGTVRRAPLRESAVS